jgi:predicted ATP-binding protein involved in virulence
VPKTISIPPFYFTSIELENVRCFGERQVLDLTDGKGLPAQWTILLGDNGVGKTTLLQCIAWMRMKPLDFPQNQNGDEPIYVEKWAPALSDEENEVFESLLRVGSRVRLELKASMCQYQRLAAPSPERKDFTTVSKLYGVKGELRNHESKSEIAALYYGEPPIFAYGAGRFMGRENLANIALEDPIASRLAGPTELYDAEEILSELDYAAAKKKRGAKKRLETVIQMLTKILPHVKRIDIYGPKILDVPGEESGVKITTPYGSVPLRALSLGYQTTLAWAVDLAWRLFRFYPDSADPLSEPAVVLIDELDLHLHPRWQRIIVGILTALFPQTQFIATAHSPLIVQAAASANLAVIQRERNHVVIENDPEVVRGWRVDQILGSDLFGVPPRDEPTERLIRRRDALIDKLNRSKTEEAELKRLEEKILNLPVAENAEDREAMRFIREASSVLKYQ